MSLWPSRFLVAPDARRCRIRNRPSTRLTVRMEASIASLRELLSANWTWPLHRTSTTHACSLDRGWSMYYHSLPISKPSTPVCIGERGWGRSFYRRGSSPQYARIHLWPSRCHNRCMRSCLNGNRFSQDRLRILFASSELALVGSPVLRWDLRISDSR